MNTYLLRSACVLVVLDRDAGAMNGPGSCFPAPTAALLQCQQPVEKCAVASERVPQLLGVGVLVGEPLG